jgi:hypothetical protein
MASAPFDHVAGREAFRQRAMTLVVATTGSTTLGSNSAGFTRATGSFYDDGFAAGMEVEGTGFPGSIGAPSIVESALSASPLAMTIAGGRSSSAQAGTRTLSVGLPLRRQWQGTQTSFADSPATRPYVSDQWVLGGRSDEAGIVETGMYVINWFGIANKGITAMLRQMQKLRDLFPPGWSAFVGDDILRVTGRPAPNFTTPVTLESGYEFSALSVPWRIITTNLDPA